MNIDKLPPLSMRKEDDPGTEKQIWQPHWNCFCCHDIGIIKPHLAALVLDGYNPNRHKFPRCMNPSCKAGSDWDSEALADCVDVRVSSLTCQKLDAIEREGWREAIKQKLENIQALARAKSLRSRDRTSLEQEEAQRRHEEASSADPSLLRAAATDYLGEKWLEEGAE